MNAAAAPGGNGQTWATAYQHPQAALDAAALPGSPITEIWIAQGTYVATQKHPSQAPESEAFRMRNNLAIRGGFAGGESSASQADPDAHVTTLSGDIGVPGDASDNADHVVEAINLSPTAILSGVNVAFGESAIGAGLRVVGTNFVPGPVFERCTFHDNIGEGTLSEGCGAKVEGGGTFIECTFRDNSGSGSGVGVYAKTGISFIACTFEHNVNGGEGGLNGLGGGAFTSGQSVLFRDCVFRLNAAWRGAGLYATGGVRIEGCLLESNTAISTGGGAYVTGSDSQGTALVATTFLTNLAVSEGGGLASMNGGPTRMAGCSFIANTAPRGAGLLDSSQLSAASCAFVGNVATSDSGGAVRRFSQPGTFVGCTFYRNTAPQNAAGIRNFSTPLTVRGCVFWNNTVGAASGEAQQILTTPAPTVEYSCIQGLTGAFGGVGNIAGDPLFVDGIGADGIPGTEDDDLSLGSGSPCIDAGSTLAFPADILDADGDGNTSELSPLDARGALRFFDVVAVVDTGAGPPPIPDMGAFEVQAGPPTGVYVGPPNGSWFTPQNWSDGAVPGTETDVTVHGSVVIGAPGAVARSVTVGGDGTLTLGVSGGIAVMQGMTVEGGGALALADASTRLAVHDLTLAANASLMWVGGEIAIDGGAFTSARTIECGCAGPATLTLTANAGALAPTIEVCANGLVRGSGTIVGQFDLGGTLSPGLALEVASGGRAGAITVDGDVSCAESATVAMELLGTGAEQRDAVTVLGHLALDGALELSAGKLLVRELGGVFDLLRADLITGAFASTNLPEAASGLGFAVESGAEIVRATMVIDGSAPRIYVRGNAAPGGDGRSWSTAARSLDGVLTAIRQVPSDTTEVWVGEGTYVPSIEQDVGDPRSAHLRMVSQVSLYGGFAGTETSTDERDISAHPTILSGDRLGNDVPDFLLSNPTLDDNLYTVVVAESCAAPTRLDGLTVQSARADLLNVADSGAGVAVDGGVLTLDRVRILSNRALREGAGLTLVNRATVDCSDCVFAGNFVTGVSAVVSEGAGVFVQSGSTCQLVGGEVSVNAGNGAVCVHGALSAENVNFVNGLTLPIRVVGGVASFTGCTIANNAGGFGLPTGAGMQAIDGAVTATDCEFTANSAAVGAAVLITGGSHLFDHCTFTGNHAATGGAISVTGGPGGATAFRECTFDGNTATGAGGAALVRFTYPVAFDGCLFSGNQSGDVGGAISVGTFGTPTLSSCTLANNVAASAGGAIDHGDFGVTALDGCVFSGNSAPVGSALRNRRGTVLLGANLGLPPGAGAGTGVVNSGSLRPGTVDNPTAITTIAGGFTQAFEGSIGQLTPSLVLDVGGTAPGSGHDQLLVSGTASVAGTLILNLLPGYEPEVGDSFDLIVADAIAGSFSAIGLAGAPNLSVELTVVGGTTLRATIAAAKPPVFGDPLVTDLQGLPRDAAVADFDNDGDLDVALAVEGVAPDPGRVVVLLNGGFVDGAWLGFSDTPVVTAVPDGPTSIAAGDWDGDGFIDIVTANANSSTVSLLRSFGGTFFFLDSTLAVGGTPNDVAIGQYVGDALPDILVARGTNSGIVIFRNKGLAGFEQALTLAAGSKPAKLALADIDLDGDGDLVAANTSDFVSNPSPLLSAHEYNGDGTFAPATFAPIGRKTSALVVADLDGDFFPDAVTGNRLDFGITILRGAPDASATFVGATPQLLLLEPFSLRDADVDLDGDRDLVGVLKPFVSGPRLQIIRNDTVPGGPITLVLADVIPTDFTPEFAEPIDVDDDGDEDLLFVSFITGGVADAAGGPTSRVSVVLSDAATSLLGDLNRDGAVNAADLAMLLGDWGVGAIADLDGDGTVSASDLALLLGAWTG